MSCDHEARSGRVTFLVAVAVLGAAACLGASARSAAADDTFVTAVDGAIAFRETSGFRHHDDFVARSFSDPSASPNHAYGLPLTAAEGAEVDRRIGVQRKVDEVVDAIADRADFAGVYTDLIGGGVPVFLVTSVDSPIGATATRMLSGVATPRVEARQDASPGDSGGPYFTTSNGVTLAWGIHSDSLDDIDPPSPGSAWYSPMQWVFSTLLNKGYDIVLCTDQYCGL